jgi:hypothetical protein
MVKWWLQQRRVSYLSDKEDFFTTIQTFSTAQRLSQPGEANWRTPSGSTTQHGRQPWQPSAPYLFRFSGTKACSPLTSLVVGATSICGVGRPPNGRRLALLRERGPFTERKAGETRARRIALLEASTRSNHPTQRAAAVIRTSSAIGMYRYGATWSNILLF